MNGLIRPLTAAVVVAGALLTACGPGPASGGAAPSPAAAAPSPSTGAGSDGTRELSGGARAYIDSVNAGDLDGLVAAFAPDGEVVDVSRRIRGADAIREWAAGEVVGGSLRVDGVTQVDPATQRVRVHWAPPGSAGWAADYTFTSAADRIVVADLQYAR